MGKVSENEVAMDQVSNNTKEQAMLGQFPEAIQTAIIDSLDTHNIMAMKALSSEQVSKGIASLVFDMLMRGATKSSEAKTTGSQ